MQPKRSPELKLIVSSSYSDHKLLFKKSLPIPYTIDGIERVLAELNIRSCPFPICPRSSITDLTFDSTDNKILQNVKGYNVCPQQEG